MREQLSTGFSSVSETRNSALRENTASIIQSVVDRLHTSFPDLSPTHLNLLGVMGVGLGSVLSTQTRGENTAINRAKTVASLTLLGVSTALDAFDGALARTIAQDSSERIDFHQGQIYDAVSDRFQELFMAISRAVSAGQRNDRLDTIAALLNASTNPLSSTARAYSESRGFSVPETGHGVLGIVGTRAGRAVLGIAATVFPEIKGVSFQLISDALVTTVNMVNTWDRLKQPANQSRTTLSPSIREEAKDRLKTLSIVTGISLGIAAFTYLYLNRRRSDVLLEEKTINEESETEEKWFLRILSSVENYCQTHDLNHRFVGGTITDFIGSETQFEIDTAAKTIHLKNHNKASLCRKDKTIKDVDLVIFSPNRQEFEEAKETFWLWEEEARRRNIPVPHISIEAARYPHWPKRNKLTQFVSAFEVDTDNKLYLTFGNFSKEIPWESIKPWKIILDDGTSLTMFHPLAHALCYMLRVPSGVKKKDMEDHLTATSIEESKISTVFRLADEVTIRGSENGIDDNLLFEDWFDYILHLQKNPDMAKRIKAALSRLYWDTIGTQVSHGAGIFNRLSTLSNKFCG